MQKEQQELANLIKGKKVAFIGAGVSHKTLIKEFVELGAHVTLCDQKKSVEDFGDYAATIKELGIDLSLGENYLDGFKGQDIIMRTPGFVGYFEKPLQDAMAAGTMVTSAPVGSELIVIQSASITMSFFWMPYFSASAQIFRAIAIRPSAVAGMPSSSIVSATTVPP